MKSSMAPSCAATSVPVDTTLNSLMFSLMPGCSAKALAVLTIWMRQVLPKKPLTRAIRYGPGFFSHWKNLVCADHGLKHWALAPGPETIFGPAQTATDDSNRLVSAKPVARPICLMALVLPFIGSAVQTRENAGLRPCGRYHATAAARLSIDF